MNNYELFKGKEMFCIKTLHDCASEGDVEGVQRLLKQGKDINERVC
jgi:hypothetical protein